MAFTAKELAVLAQLAYRDADVKGEQHLNMNEYLTEYESYLREKLGESYYEAIEI